jgi:hypothetical protein
MGKTRTALLCLVLLSAFILGSEMSGGPAGDPAPPIPVQASPGQDEPQLLNRLLVRAADYCARLSRASLDFVCLEEVSEKTYEQSPFSPPSPGAFLGRRNDIVEHRYLYDYQFVTEDGQKTEKRRILQIDGIKRKAEDTALDTTTFFYQNVLFGPVDLLAGSRQGFYRYTLRGREFMAGQAVAVIEAVPAPGLAISVNQGTIWIRESDAAILKIVWNVRSMENSAAIRETAKKYNGTPQILQVTEFQVEKNGVHFPNRFSVEEAYVNKKGKKLVRSVLDAVYRDYKFFTVEVETSSIKQPPSRS